MKLKKHKIKHSKKIWKIKTVQAYSVPSKQWNCCQAKEIAIITFPEEYKLLNKGLKLISKCRYENKFILCYLKLDHDSQTNQLITHNLNL